MIEIGSEATSWSAPAYVKGKEQRVSAADYAGRWYVLYWYPLDFTFVCPTEIRGFEKLSAEFEREDLGLVGASTDSFYSHQAWFADRKTFQQEITHPVLADTSHAVARSFGVLKEDEGIAYRATFVVDDQGLVRSIGVNDLGAGRSPAEVLRTAQALRSGGLCAADWAPGDGFVA
ncbi:MAG: peroxiredoxin [Proteobacteria bacterium]|nr:peroxiredoxin [Pseudomonadota bacterium]